ncbi:hypothetical protein BaRGS_00038993 [Batillaria attramentaria]|uniref:Uncharacterized protein n=1 Tax=Batillaria attramentaria TaxID=370345 RepID=A0ABD0J5E9_9CAEN
MQRTFIDDPQPTLGKPHTLSHAPSVFSRMPPDTCRPHTALDFVEQDTAVVGCVQGRGEPAIVTTVVCPVIQVVDSAFFFFALEGFYCWLSASQCKC